MNSEAYKKLDKYKKEYESVCMSDEAFMQMQRRMAQAKKEKKDMKNNKKIKGFAIAAAAALVIFITPNTSGTVAHAMGNIPVVGAFFKVITIRDFSYEDDKKSADIETPAISVEDENLKKSTEEINAEIQKITKQYEKDFKESLENDGYKDVAVKSEVVNTTAKYFTLKLSCYETEASSYEMDYYYTIDLATGKRLELKDLFKAGTDYETALVKDINSQMRAQMKADENVSYWLDEEDMPDWSFDELRNQVSFYINSDGKLVISFNQGDVAPMYMGVVEFVVEKTAFPTGTVLY